MEWRTLRLELAPSREFPTGSVARSYLVRLPFDSIGGVSAEALDGNSRRATVRRYWSSEADQWGHAVRDGAGIALSIGGQTRILTFSEPIAVGSLAEVEDGEGRLVFRIASIRSSR